MDGTDATRRWSRPVADAPSVDAVVLTKAWLVALVTRAPLHEAARIPAAELAHGGPVLCAALLAALGTDTALERLSGLAPGVGGLTGANNPPAVIAAIEALRSVTWRAVRGAVEEDPAPGLAGDLSDRLADLCALLAQRAVPAALEQNAATPEVHAVPPAGGPPEGARVVSMPIALGERDPLTSLADELAVAAREAFGEAPDATTVVRGAPDVPGAPTVRRRARGTSWDDDVASAPPWLAAIVRRLEQRERDGQPFAVLVAEVDDLDRLLVAQSGHEVSIALEVAERSLTAELAPADLVVRERLGRWWLTGPNRSPVAARDLADRVAAAIAGARLAGVPLAASVGLAVCPQDGEDLEALAAKADERMFAARAAGGPVG